MAGISGVGNLSPAASWSRCLNSPAVPDSSTRGGGEIVSELGRRLRRTGGEGDEKTRRARVGEEEEGRGGNTGEEGERVRERE